VRKKKKTRGNKKGKPKECVVKPGPTGGRGSLWRERGQRLSLPCRRPGLELLPSYRKEQLPTPHQVLQQRFSETGPRGDFPYQRIFNANRGQVEGGSLSLNKRTASRLKGKKGEKQRGGSTKHVRTLHSDGDGRLKFQSEALQRPFHLHLWESDQRNRVNVNSVALSGTEWGNASTDFPRSG